MNIWISIILIIGLLLLATYLDLVRKKTKKTKRIAWTICLLISLSATYGLIKQEFKERQAEREKAYYQN